MPLQPPPGIPKSVLALGIVLTIVGAFRLLYFVTLTVTAGLPPGVLTLLEGGALTPNERFDAVWHVAALAETLAMLPAGLGLLRFRAWGWYAGLLYGVVGCAGAAAVMCLSAGLDTADPATPSYGPLSYIGLFLFPVLAFVVLLRKDARRVLLRGERAYAEPTSQTE